MTKQLKAKCCACKEGFETEKDYLEHVCAATSFTPTRVEHADALSDGKFSKISAQALKRGAAKQ